MKNSILKIFSIIMVVMFAFTTVACEKGGTTTPKEEISITANPSKVDLVKGDVVDLNVEVTGTTNKEVNYMISNPTLVTVVDGVLTVVGDVDASQTVTVVIYPTQDPSKQITKVFNIKKYVEPKVEITNVRTTLTEGETLTLTVNVAGLTNTAYALSTSHPEIISISENEISVIKGVSVDTKVTITAMSVEDNSVVGVKEFIVKAPSSIGSITINASQDTIKEGETVMLSATVVGLTSQSVTWTVSNDELVEIVNGGLVLKQNVVVDTNITVTATSTVDESVYKSKTITIKAPIIDGQVGYLNASVLEKIANPSITFTGTVTDYYNDLRNTFNSTKYEYDQTVMMSDGRYYGAWNIKGNTDNVIIDNYRRGTGSDVTDVNGITGKPLEELYIDMHNTVSYRQIKNYQSVPTVWETQHLWNHLGQLPINKFTYSPEDELHTYTLEANNLDMAYLMTYLSYCLTPMLSDTLNSISFVIENDEIVKIIARTKILYYGADTNEDPDAMSYSELVIVPSNIGTTVVPEPTPFTAPEHKDLLVNALNSVKNATSYTYLAKETTTYAPSGDSGDYELAYTSPQTPSVRMLNRGLVGEVIEAAVHNNVSSTGTVGDRGWVTSDAILIAKTTKYTYSSDGKDYRTEYSGYKKITDDSYDEFKYSTTSHVLEGSRRVSAPLSSVLPKFDFSADIFEFVGTRGSGENTTYTFKLGAAKVSRDVAMQTSLHSYAKDAIDDVETPFTIVVNGLGQLVSITFPYSLNSTYFGYITTTFSALNETVIPENAFEGYIPRAIRTTWDQYTCSHYSTTHSTLDSKPENAQVVLDAIFGTAVADLPNPDIFVRVFDDIVFGPFYNWKDRDGGGFIDYVSINVQSSEFDENTRITNYTEIMDELITELQEVGYTKDDANTDTSGGPIGLSERVVTLYKGGIQIVITCNGTRHLSIYFYHLGDYILK